MRYFVLASDYDGTLAQNGVVDQATFDALVRLKRSGRRIVLVTGRELPDLLRVFPGVDVCDRVVAENGAVLYTPADRETRVLAEPPPPEFVEALRVRGVSPLSVGHAIVSTWQPNEQVVLQVILELGLELFVTFNKGAVMVLPSGVNKATGLRAALDDIGISPHNTAGIGDAENDHAFLQICECRAAVANALPALRHEADWVASEPRGRGVAQLIDLLLGSDGQELQTCRERHRIVLGHDGEGRAVELSHHDGCVIVAGASGGGKSTATTTFLERLVEQAYQFCLIDPEGDYEGLHGAGSIGGVDHLPRPEEVVGLLEPPAQNVVVNLLGVRLADRPRAGAMLLSSLSKLRAHAGHPHWIVCDEAHHVLPAGFQSFEPALPERLDNTLLVTTDPANLHDHALRSTEVILAVGNEPVKTLRSFYDRRGVNPPVLPEEGALQRGEALVSAVKERLVRRAAIDLPRRDLLRHRRKYAEGELGPDKSFYFRGPGEKLNLRAQNLALFLQIAEGLDDETWNHHLARHDYSRWFREALKDEELAERASRIEDQPEISSAESRARLHALISERYTLPG